MARRTRRGSGKKAVRRASAGASRPGRSAGRRARRAALIIDANQPLQVFLNPAWREYGQASIMALRRHPSGGYAWAAFLVDLGVTGLKDAFGDLDGSPDEFQSILEAMDASFGMAPAPAEEVLRLIAGGMRYAQDYGFRLPHDAERWASVIGPLGDWAHTADTSDFVPEFAATVRDLELRLVGSTPEEFLRRDDIDFIIPDDDFSLLDEAQTEQDDALQMMRDRAVDAVGRWCAEHGRPPHPRLADAWDLFVQDVFAGLSPLADDVPDEDPEPGNPNDSHTASAADGVQRLLSLQPPADREQLSAAFDQISQCVAAQSNPMSFIAQMGLGLPGAEE